MHKVAARKARLAVPTVRPQGQIPLHDELVARVEGRGLDARPIAHEPRARCALALARWLNGEPARGPAGPPPFDPEPLCAFVDALVPHDAQDETGHDIGLE